MDKQLNPSAVTAVILGAVIVLLILFAIPYDELLQSETASAGDTSAEVIDAGNEEHADAESADEVAETDSTNEASDETTADAEGEETASESSDASDTDEEVVDETPDTDGEDIASETSDTTDEETAGESTSAEGEETADESSDTTDEDAETADGSSDDAPFVAIDALNIGGSDDDSDETDEATSDDTEDDTTDEAEDDAPFVAIDALNIGGSDDDSDETDEATSDDTEDDTTDEGEDDAPFVAIDALNIVGGNDEADEDETAPVDETEAAETTEATDDTDTETSSEEATDTETSDETSTADDETTTDESEDESTTNTDESDATEATDEEPVDEPVADENVHDPELIAQGESLFLGGGSQIGCAYCHGEDALGDFGPNIRGKSPEAILQAMGMVDQMMVVSNFTPDEIEAVSAYLLMLADEANVNAADTVTDETTDSDETDTTETANEVDDPVEVAEADESELDPELVEQGRALFLGGGSQIGCAYCHGPDALGDFGPNIQGKSPEAILQAMGLVDQMMVVSNFTPDEIEAVATYLQFLADEAHQEIPDDETESTDEDSADTDEPTATEDDTADEHTEHTTTDEDSATSNITFGTTNIDPDMETGNTVEFTLRAVAGNVPSMAYEGEGGAIEGQINPALFVKVGDTVTINLINDDMMAHDLTIDEYAVSTGELTFFGEEASITFTVTEAGNIFYYCSVPGHRTIGMEGLIIATQ